MVHGGLRYGGRQHFWGDVCVCTRHGAAVADDLPPSVPRLYCGLCRCGLRAPPTLLSSEPHEHLCLSGTAPRRTVVSDGRLVLPIVEDDGRSREVLCGVHDSAAVCLRSCRHPVCRECGLYGVAHLAVYPSWGHCHAGVYRHLPDDLPFHVAHPDYPICHQSS